MFNRSTIILASLLSRLTDVEPAPAAGCPAPTFVAAGTFRAGTNAVDVAVADLNGDGKPDLAVANQQSENISILLGSGDGSQVLMDAR